MNIMKLPYRVFNCITLGLPEIERKEKLRSIARERLEERFANLGNNEGRILKGEELPIQEDNEGTPSNENVYFEGTRKYEKLEQLNEEKRKRGEKVRPETPSQDFLDKYFPSKVPLGKKTPIYETWVIECDYCAWRRRPRILCYGRDKFYHSSLRDTVGLYHSLLELGKNSGEIKENEYNGSMRDLEEFLGKIKANSKLKKPSTNQSKYNNISTLVDLSFAIDISRELE